MGGRGATSRWNSILVNAGRAVDTRSRILQRDIRHGAALLRASLLLGLAGLLFFGGCQLVTQSVTRIPT